ncbi:ornithine carbamoyltransferase [Myxococcota bacterium]|nr:ornithine carbamoyltransferase [Myxococcota bacterium]MBU1899232.1 ornithine carbamoyltransferase [Myxococcota bacterium]
MSKRDFLALTDLSTPELYALLNRAIELKDLWRKGGRTTPLAGKTLAMIFEKASTRTRVSFEVGMFQLGGHALMISTATSQLGRGETIEDTAKVLSGYVDGIMIRTFEHSKVEELARHATIPIINGLTDFNHPCQLLADLMTAVEVFGAARLKDLKVAWIGDGNNMAHSWMIAAKMLGFELRIACPEAYMPNAELVARLKGEARIEILHDAAAAAEGAHIVTTDVWASMGQEAEQQARAAVFAPFIVNAEVMGRAASDAIFLHCLPAHRGEEVSAEVIDGPQSVVFQEAENRLHAQKALMEMLMGGRVLR